MNKKVLSLLFLRQDDKILLAMKKRGFGEGRWNGVGGKVETGESVEQAMIRETQEEIDVTPTVYEKVADIRFDEYFKGEPTLMHVHVFVATEWVGDPIESDEMAPQWFPIEDIPYKDMWSDDPYWLPHVLHGAKVSADFQLDAADVIMEHTINEVVGFKDD
ncbi:MAG: 7,8-dihydro-8-oxoguanine triphosphatase-like [Candidatus Saccharibacteria bacterium]|nr:7,8-dihydro-8-oxoguanine triphosphatase-like [Candidatus Saccharibacteria bacterium]